MTLLECGHTQATQCKNCKECLFCNNNHTINNNYIVCEGKKVL